MQWHAISESLTERPLRTEVVLDTLTSVSKPCDGWQVEAGIFIPSEIDAAGTWENLIEGNTPSSRNEMTRCDETALLKDENEDSKLIEKVDALQDVSEESELGDAIVSNTESKIEHAREVTSDREPVLCRGPGHVRESGLCYFVDDRFGRHWQCKRQCATIEGQWGPTICCEECSPEPLKSNWCLEFDKKLDVTN